MVHRAGSTALVIGLSALAGCVEAPAARTASANEVACPSGSEWDGAKCVRKLVVTEVTCPPGSSWADGKCIGKLEVECPSGTRFVEAVGCVAELSFEAAAPAPKSPEAPAASPSQTGGAPAKQPPSNDPLASNRVPVVDPWGARQPTQNTGREFNRGAAVAALNAASVAAKSCAGQVGTGRVRVVFSPSGAVSSATVDGAPFAGTPQGGCIAGAFRAAKVPPFEGSPVTVSKSVTIP